MKMKRILSFLLAAVLFASAAVSASAVTKLRGDIDSNGKIDAADARLALRYSVKLDTPNADQKKSADINGDGAVTAADARMILRMSVDLEPLAYYTVEDHPASEPEETESEQAARFRSILYDVAHENFNSDKNYGKNFTEIHMDDEVRSPLELVYGTAGKWCCYYTIHDVFRVALKKAGYSDARVNELAPLYYPKKTIATAVSNILNSETNDYKEVAKTWNIPSALIPSNVPFYIPSVLMDYYQNASENICTTYTFHVYWDDVLTDSLITRSKNAGSYKPKVGDVIFMSNKSSTYYKGYCTVDHTAQIIKVYDDGSFLCTEGSIIIDKLPDKLPRVRERRYIYSKMEKTYLYQNNDIVKVLAAVRPAL